MKKRVLLVDNELRIIPHILKDTDWIIEVLVTEKKDNMYTNHQRVGLIYEEDDFWNNRNMQGFDYEDLEFLWKSQLKGENCFNRFLEDFQIGKWNYYRGYALVKQIFSSRQIDLVIVKGHNHGYAWDRTITEYASMVGIHSYNIEIMLNGTRIVYNNLNKQLVEVEKHKLDLNNSVFYHEELDISNNMSKGVWGKIYKVSYNLFGALGLDIIKCIRYGNLGTDKKGVSVIERAKKLYQVKKTKNYFSRLAVPLDITRKYVCFALHLEPEAVIAGRADMDSQIVAIQMLANCLPKGWVLYVKEHPLQFMLNHANMYGYLYGASVFKTKRFYKEINQIDNVKLLKLNTDNKEMLEHCQAVATMSGTVAAEAVTYHKPALVFSAERTIYNYVEGFYKISSDDECKKAMQDIENNKIVNYEDYLEVCKKYLINFTDESLGYKVAVKTIFRDASKSE